MKKPFFFVLSALICVFLGALAPFHVQAYNNHHHALHNERGYTLENNYWLLVQKQDFDTLAKMYSHAFQGNSAEGVLTAEQSLAQLEGACLKKYSFKDFTSTRKKNVIVNAYNLFPVGKGLIPGSNISVWKKEGKHWELESHSFFPLP